MVDRKTKMFANAVYNRVIGRMFGAGEILRSVDLEIETLGCENWKEGKGYCQSRAVRCLNVKNCPVSGKANDLKKLHGNASFGETGWDDWR